MDDWSVRLRRAVAQQLESLQNAGVDQLPGCTLNDVAEPTGVQAAPAPASTAPTAMAAPTRPAAATESAERSGHRSITHEQATTLLAELRHEVSNCRRCDELACTRKQTVFGVGSAAPRLCFFGEAPGHDEDQQGEPFVGAAGQLLTDIIQKGMGMRREDVYILNVLKCRPPGNRNPTPDEIENCRGYYEQQLAILQPEFICCLGAFAAQTLLDTEQPVGRMRGRMHSYQNGQVNAQVVVTYHPAYLLRAPAEKRKTWDDIKMLMAAMKASA